MKHQKIVLKNVSVHNLKGVNLELPVGAFIVFTGVSGSGKSSLAFDTLFVEGQRRYIESLPSGARKQLENLSKPDCEGIEGLSPTIAIQQKTVGKNPRSTVGTLTGIYDYLRVLFARLGVAHCPLTGQTVTACSKEDVATNAFEFARNRRVLILSPQVKGKKGEFKDLFEGFEKEGFRRVRVDGEIYDLEEVVELDPKKAHDIDLVIDRLEVSETDKGRFIDSIFTALVKGSGLVKVALFEDKEEKLFSTGFYASLSDMSYPELQPQDFSFNQPEGMCPECQGLGEVFDFDEVLIIDPNKSLSEDACSIAGSYHTVKWGNIYRNLAELYDFSLKTAWKDLSEKAKKVFLYGTGAKWLKIHYIHPEKKSRWTDYIQWSGVIGEAKKRFSEASSELYKEKMQALMIQKICPVCHGARIKAYPAATTLWGRKLFELTAMSLEELLQFFKALSLTETEKLIGEELIKEIVFCLNYLNEVGIGYLSLDRTSPTLSGGEAQRVRLAAQLGCGLSGITYILDEPSIGLHPRDNAKLISTLHDLKEQGNTVIVVEHDEETILAADYLVEIGPGAGVEGGRIIFEGSPEKIFDSKASITGPYLRKAQKGTSFKAPRFLDRFIEVEGVYFHNLKNLKARLPLQGLVGIVGVSGSGKSSLISDILYPHLSNLCNRSRLTTQKVNHLKGFEAIDKVIQIDQAPIGRSPRSNPATYIKLWDDIRELYALLPDSKALGLTLSHFSFNTKSGSCLSCGGMGMIKIDMDFMEDAYLECHHCEGKRFDPKTLSVKYKDKSIFDILKMSVQEAQGLFEAIPKIFKKLNVLERVGLGYLTLGQSSTTLSGGEAQRIKLAKELSRPASGKTLYIFDEPTTGLHPKDIERLLDILQALVDQGNSAWVIEHNIEFIKACDYLVEMGPEAGAGGGLIIAEGAPETFLKKKTATALAIQTLLRSPKRALSSPLQLGGIRVQGAMTHNLKGVDALIPYGQITVCTGPSGSGKSSFAFDTLYAEGQRRYTDSLPNYTQQFIKLLPKPKVEKISGLLSAIAIEQRGHVGNPRSTVGTMTEVYDYLRVLYAQAGQAFCPETGAPIRAISSEFILEELFKYDEGSRLQILAPLKARTEAEFKDIQKGLEKAGYLRIYLNDKLYEVDQSIPFNPRLKNQILAVIDRIKLQKSNKTRLFEALKSAKELGKNELFVWVGEDEKRYFNLSFAAIDTGRSYPNLTPATFSFNAEEGMCPVCYGLGVQFSQLKLELLEEEHPLWIDLLDAVLIGGLPVGYDKLLEKLFAKHQASLYHTLSEPALFVLEGGGKSTVVETKRVRLKYRGIQQALARAALHAKSPFKGNITPYLSEKICPSCEGERLNPLARRVTLEGMTLGALCKSTLKKAYLYLVSLRLSAELESLLKETMAQITSRLELILEMGLGYLSLERKTPTLSGGEAQRVRLSQQLGSGLTGCLYVLDEPTIGLHPHNNELLNKALVRIKNKGNTLVLVEHDPLTMTLADQILDFGEKAGQKGGKIVARGSYQEILVNPSSLTGQYLSRKKHILVPRNLRKPKGFLELKKVDLHNLKQVDVRLPLGVLCGITGVSGSGKSSLIKSFLAEALQMALKTAQDMIQFPFGQVQGMAQFEKLILLTQEPLGTTSRADVSTYVDLLTPLRQFFAALPQAQSYGLAGKHFSYNHKAGMCQKCWGMGYKKIKLQYLPDVKTVCENCQGYRLNPLSLNVKYQGRHLGQILSLSVDEAAACLPMVPKVQKRIELLQEVGLGYLPLNQEVAHLSGGEGQRLRLAKELSKRSHKKSLYILDEPTVGLHPSDIALLLPIFQRMIDQGASFIIIEHNLDVLKSCDYLIELGPGSGEEGGYLIAEGTPRELSENALSVTGPYLKSEFLSKKDLISPSNK